MRRLGAPVKDALLELLEALARSEHDDLTVARDAADEIRRLRHERAQAIANAAHYLARVTELEASERHLLAELEAARCRARRALEALKVPPEPSFVSGGT